MGPKLLGGGRAASPSALHLQEPYTPDIYTINQSDSRQPEILAPLARTRDITDGPLRYRNHTGPPGGLDASEEHQ